MKKVLALIIIISIGLSILGCSNKTNSDSLNEEKEMNQKCKLELPEDLVSYSNSFEKSIKPFIKITTKKEKTLAWESKFGGTPYLPLDYEYPKDIKGSPMRLLAQINFDEVPNIAVFPSKGILQFYISSKDDIFGMNFDKPTAQENFKVIYIPEIIKDETKIQHDFCFVSTTDEDSFPIGAEGKLQFETAYAPVASRDYQFEKFFNTTSADFFSKIGENGDFLWDWYEKSYSSNGHKMAGYAFFTQSDPRTNKYKEYDTLLLQIDTDDELSIMWGDCGVANFFINSEDLEKLNFTNVLYNWDCY